MARMSENYYLRQWFLNRDQAPTQTMMTKKMKPPLAKVYFDSMNQNLKVLAGFEPRMKGGGNDWAVSPGELLNGRVVMKPVKKEFLKKLGYDGIAYFGDMLAEKYRKEVDEEMTHVLNENDINWKQNIELSVQQAWNDAAKVASKENTSAIQQAFHEFTTIYTSSINNIETLLIDGAVKEIQAMQDATLQKLKDQYADLLDKQARMLYDKYAKKLNREKTRLKANFIKRVEIAHTVMARQIHDLNLEKHIVIEKLRQSLESINLACQVYVALKERNECHKEIDLSKHEQKKTAKSLQMTIAMKDFEIQLAQNKENKREEFNTAWKKKMCEVVKKLQMFVVYCFKILPEQSDFFIDMEKLMMLQLDQATENPSVPSIFVPEPDKDFQTPIPKPHPFYLCCDKGYEAEIDQKLCPKHCTSSASQLPVVVVNKRCIYAACDNFEKFTEKVTEFVHGRRGGDIDFEDNHNYKFDCPFKMTSSQQQLELRLESSLMQVLQKEIPNIKEVPIECCLCKIPHCFCSATDVLSMGSNVQQKPQVKTSSESMSSGTKIETRSVELLHEREPKWESYMRYVTPNCKCGKTAKKHLEQRLPAYMRNMSMFEQPELPNYEMCSTATLKRLVKKAQRKRPTLLPPVKVESKTRDICTQYSDQEFEALCTCFSDDEVKRIFKTIVQSASNLSRAFNVMGSDLAPEYTSAQPTAFAKERAESLRNLMHGSPQMLEIFRKTNCNN